MNRLWWSLVQRSRGRWRQVLAGSVAVASSASLLAPPASRAEEGAAFEPLPASAPVYGISSPEDDPARQTDHVVADDGTELFVEVWLPAAAAAVPPERVPVVLAISPYLYNERVVPMAATDAGVPLGSMMTTLMPHLVQRGYAFALADMRGTGRSGGCWDDFGPTLASDGVRLVEWAADASWSSGDVGMVGVSAMASAAWATATSGEAPQLKAIAPASGFGSLYDMSAMDGAPDPAWNVYDSSAFNVFGAAVGSPERIVERPCQTQQVVASLDWSGDFTPYWQDREHRDGLANLRAATFVQHGLHDHVASTRAYRGLLDQVPPEVPLKVMLGGYRHGNPGSAEGNPASVRADYFDMLTAWFDRYLKDLPTKVETWPDYQVVDANGQWRAEHRWVDAPLEGALALSSGGVLGSTSPAGTTSYVQATAEGSGGSVSFTTPPLAADLRIWGAPELDIALRVSDPAAKVGVRLEVVDPTGAARGIPYSTPTGGRSMRHLGELVDGRFAQVAGVDPPVDDVFRTTIRIQPTEMLVPAGWRLRLSLFSLVGSPPAASGHGVAVTDTTGFDGLTSTITVVHDCDNPTVLRFAMADPNAKLLNVRQPTDSGELPSAPPSSPRIDVDGGGLAMAPIC